MRLPVAIVTAGGGLIVTVTGAVMAAVHWAQITAPSGPLVDPAVGIGGLVGSLGAGGLGLGMWRYAEQQRNLAAGQRDAERAERIATTAQHIQFLERLGPMVAEASKTLADVQSSVRSMGTDWDRRGAEWDRRETEYQRQIETTLTELRRR